MLTDYTTSQAATITGASVQTIRAYTKLYARYFSTGATPEQGQSRRFTPDDLRLIRFCLSLAQQNLTRDAILEKLAAGELAHFDWQPAQEAPEATQEPETSSSTMLVPYEHLRLAQGLLIDAQRREAEALEREQAARAEAAAAAQALQAEVQRLALELGKATGEAAALRSARYRSPRWWRLVFGGRGE